MVSDDLGISSQLDEVGVAVRYTGVDTIATEWQTKGNSGVVSTDEHQVGVKRRNRPRDDGTIHGSRFSLRDLGIR